MVEQQRGLIHSLLKCSAAMKEPREIRQHQLVIRRHVEAAKAGARESFRIRGRAHGRLRGVMFPPSCALRLNLLREKATRPVEKFIFGIKSADTPFRRRTIDRLALTPKSCSEAENTFWVLFRSFILHNFWPRPFSSVYIPTHFLKIAEIICCDQFP